jgi:hypothetical protein
MRETQSNTLLGKLLGKLRCQCNTIQNFMIRRNPKNFLTLKIRARMKRERHGAIPDDSHIISPEAPYVNPWTHKQD